MYAFYDVDKQFAADENACHHPGKMALVAFDGIRTKSKEIDGHDRHPLSSITNRTQINILSLARNKQVQVVNQFKQRVYDKQRNTSKLLDDCSTHESLVSQLQVLDIVSQLRPVVTSSTYETQFTESQTLDIIRQLRPVVICSENSKRVVSNAIKVVPQLHYAITDHPVGPLLVPATESILLEHQRSSKNITEPGVQSVQNVDSYGFHREEDKLEQQYRERQDCLFSLTEYSQDVYHYLRAAELRHCPKAQYMRKQSEVTHAMRSILIDWLVDVAIEYKLHQQTLYLCVNFIDRFLSSMLVLKSKLQLVGITAMFLAAKYEEICAPDISEFVYITEDAYSKKQILRMELMMLRALSFNLTSPTAFYFCSLILKENRADSETSSLALYLTELTLVNGEMFLKYLPSVIASAAIFVAYETLHANSWTSSLEDITSYKVEHLDNCIRDIRNTFQFAAQFPQKAIYRKYDQTRLGIRHSFLTHCLLLRVETCHRCPACDVDLTVELQRVSFAIACDRSFNMTVTTLSELFSKVSSRSMIEFIKKTGLYRKI